MQIEFSATKTTDEKGKKVKLDENVAGKFDYNLGDNLLDATELHGEELVYDFFVRGAKVKLQNIARSSVENGKTVEEAVEEAQNYKLGEVRRGDISIASARKKLAETIKGMTPEEALEWLQEM